MIGEYIRRDDLLIELRSYLKKKIDDGESALDTVDAGVEIMRMICKMEGVDMPGGERWVSAKDELPDDEGCVLALVSGEYRSVVFVNAVMLAYYVDGEWILEGYPMKRDFVVSHWAEIPEAPAGLFCEQERNMKL